ncbi:hypothetical protein [Cellulomonas sp.]|uniref:hypothetical protein n=1 Tax=Cellulomonas sp. TaxID=40001 RepID=UPI002D47CE23|nr:hypothetical protein [Cellulomonas sp.]HYQ73890.1 hypothetical protein [Cellulomonas sp.]
MRVDTVTTRRDLAAFLRLPLDLHPRDLAVPLQAPTIRSWWRGTSPHPGPVELLLARDDAGRVVGRTTAHRDDRFDAKLGTRALLFGATEFAGAEAAGALFAALEARATGERELIGPVSLLPNQTGGVVTSGWAERGFVDSPWNPADVPGTYEAAGFRRWHEADTWVVDVRPVAAPGPAEWAAAGVRPERGSRRAMGRLVPELLDLLNASFAQLPYYTPITPAEMRAATDGLAWLLDERLLLLARDDDGAAVAFVLAVPDITRFLQATGGRLGPVEQLRLLATRGRYREDAVLVIQGTRPDRQGRGILTLLSRELHAGLSAGGYRRLRMTSVGRDNPASARQSERFGGRPLHGLTFYRRPVPSRERA